MFACPDNAVQVLNSDAQVFIKIQGKKQIDISKQAGVLWKM